MTGYLLVAGIWLFTLLAAAGIVWYFLHKKQLEKELKRERDAIKDDYERLQTKEEKVIDDIRSSQDAIKKLQKEKTDAEKNSSSVLADIRNARSKRRRKV